MNGFRPIDEHTESIAKLAVDGAYTVHKNLGQGFWKKFMKFVSATN